MITVDFLNKSVISVLDNRKKNTIRHPRKRWYFKKSLRGAKVIKTMLNYLYEIKKENESMYFVTITTLQHKSNKSDKELFNRVGLWLKNRKLYYVCTTERQGTTEDIHFHIAITSPSKFNIRYELARLSKLLGVPSHPALFDVQRITSVKNVIFYITKYITKDNSKYSSLFTCRTFSISNRLRQLYKKNADKYVLRISANDRILGAAKNYSNFIAEAKKNNLLVPQYVTDFFWIYKYNVDIWELINRFKAKHLQESS